MIRDLGVSASELIGTTIFADVPLMSTGLDSIAATALSTRLGERLNTALSQTLLFDHPSLRSIAGSLSLDRASSSIRTRRRIEADETESSRAGSTRLVEQQVPAVVDAISAVFLEIQGTVAAVDASLATAGMDSIAMTELAAMHSEHGRADVLSNVTVRT